MKIVYYFVIIKEIVPGCAYCERFCLSIFSSKNDTQKHFNVEQFVGL